MDGTERLVDFKTEMCPNCHLHCTIIVYYARFKPNIVSKVIPNCCPQKQDMIAKCPGVII